MKRDGGSIRVRVIASLIRGVIGVLGRSCRWRIEGDRDPETWLREHDGPVVVATWHQHAALLGYWFPRRLLSRGYRVASLSSQSRDGEIGTRVSEGWGSRVIRGSSSRGGSLGLRRLYRAMVKDGLSVVMLPDAPRGPRREAKPGTVILAQMGGVPIVPLGFHAHRAWRLKSWDRMIVPKPFSRVAVRMGEPLEVPAGEDRETARRRLERALDDVLAEPPA